MLVYFVLCRPQIQSKQLLHQDTNPSEVGRNNGYMPEIASAAQEDDDFVNAALATGKMGRTASLQRVASLEHLRGCAVGRLRPDRRPKVLQH